MKLYILKLYCPSKDTLFIKTPPFETKLKAKQFANRHLGRAVYCYSQDCQKFIKDKKDPKISYGYNQWYLTTTLVEEWEEIEVG